MSESAHSSVALKTMQLNDQKAGMQGLDKEAINKIIHDASQGTPYFSFQQKRQQHIDRQIKEKFRELEKVSESQRKQSLGRMNSLCQSLESERDVSRSIVHIDMDAFYAAVEMLDNPDLRSKPMAVGSMTMLSTSNYEARKYGVRAAMPGFIAKKLCPELTIVPCNFDKYRRISKQIRSIIKEYDPNSFASSLDEVYLDLTKYIYDTYHKEKHSIQCEVTHSEASLLSHSNEDDNEMSVESDDVSYCKNCICDISNATRDKLAYEIVEEIRKKIFEATQLTASAGIAPTTMLAKVCSDQNKPNGQYQIHSDVEEVKAFIQTLPVKKISGIGPVQSQLLNALGIYTCGDLYNKRDLVDLLFSPTSVHFYMRVGLGLGSTVVKSDHIRKSIGVEITFREISKPEELYQKCQDLCNEVVEDLKSRHLMGKVVVLKIKTVNFDTHTRNLTLLCHTSDDEVIYKAAKKLLDGEIKMASPAPLKLRLMGVRMTNLIDESEMVDEKQAKLKDFLQPKTDGSGVKALHSGESKKQYVCPVCSLEMTNCINAFNKHVDQCLMSHETPKSNEIPNTSTCEEQQRNLGVISQQNNGVDTEESQVENASENKTKPFCPVCGIEQKSNELADLNLHIDNCLSKVAIKELLSSDSSNQIPVEKRKSFYVEKKGKKRKAIDKTLNTIDQYFQEH